MFGAIIFILFFGILTWILFTRGQKGSCCTTQSEPILKKNKLRNKIKEGEKNEKRSGLPYAGG
jgi:hypothetical protein